MVKIWAIACTAGRCIDANSPRLGEKAQWLATLFEIALLIVGQQ